MPFAMVSPSRPGNAQLLPPYADSQGIGLAPTTTNPPPSAVPAGFHALPGRERPVQVPHHRQPQQPQPQQASYPPFAGGGPHPPVGEDSHTLYRMQPILSSPGNMRRLPAQVPLQPQQQQQQPFAGPQPATPFDKATGKTINSIVEIRRLEHVIGDMFHAGTTQVTGYPSPDPQLSAAPPLRSATRPPVEENHLQHPESAVFDRPGSPAHLRASSPQALRYDSPRHGSPPSSPHLRRIPSPPGVGYPAASPRRMEALAAEWQAHASDLESRLARHAHNLAESKAAAERNASILAAHTSPQRYDPWSAGAAGAAGANPHAAPPSVHTDDLENAIGLDDVQHLAVDEHNKRREGAGAAGGAPVRFDVLCKELAQEAAEQMLAGAPAPSPETTLGGQQGQFAFRPQAKVGPVEALQLALGDKGSEAQVLSPSLTHLGLGYASNATACVVVVNYSPKHSG